MSLHLAIKQFKKLQPVSFRYVSDCDFIKLQINNRTRKAAKVILKIKYRLDAYVTKEEILKINELITYFMILLLCNRYTLHVWMQSFICYYTVLSIFHFNFHLQFQF